MTLSQPIEDYSDTHRSRWLAAGNASARNALFDSQSLATSILASPVQLATCPLRPHQRGAANQLPLPLRTKLRRAHTAVKSP
jgi:hypothetical protein